MAVTLLAVHDGLLDLLADGDAWTAGSYQASLWLRGTWTPGPGDATISTALAAGAVEMAAPSYARVSLASLISNLDSLGHKRNQTSDPMAFGVLETGFDYDTLVIETNTGADATDVLLFSFDLTALTTDGVNAITANPDSTALFQLGA